MANTNSSKGPILVPVIVAIIAGTLAGIPALLDYVQTPAKIKGELEKTRTEIRLQSDAQIRLQREQEVGRVLARLSDADPKVQTGAALSLSVMGGEDVVPILVGKLRESAAALYRLAKSTDQEGITEKMQRELEFLDGVKHTLLTIGLPSLPPLIELNRELHRGLKSEVKAVINATRRKQDVLADLRLFEVVPTNFAREEVKDVIRSLLLRLSRSKTLDQSYSLLAQKGISLANTDLSGILLYQVDLSGVNLRNADLRNSSLEESDLRAANLERALLQNTVILEANFEGANLRGASLEDIKDYGKVNVTGADFSNAKINSRKLRDYLKSHGGLNVP